MAPSTGTASLGPSIADVRLLGVGRGVVGPEPVEAAPRTEVGRAVVIGNHLEPGADVGDMRWIIAVLGPFAEHRGERVARLPQLHAAVDEEITAIADGDRVDPRADRNQVVAIAR